LLNANDLAQHAEELNTFISIHNIDIMLFSKHKEFGIITTKCNGYSDASQNFPQATNFSYIKQYQS
jgi:hypothetical protein